MILTQGQMHSPSYYTNQPQDGNPTMTLRIHTTHTKTFRLFIYFLHYITQNQTTPFFSDDQEADPNSPPFWLEIEAVRSRKDLFLRSRSRVLNKRFVGR